MSFSDIVILFSLLISATFVIFFQYKSLQNLSDEYSRKPKRYFHGWDNGIFARHELNEKGKIYYDKSMKAGFLFCLLLLLFVFKRMIAKYYFNI